jgi:anti-sigma-K factor RskA
MARDHDQLESLVAPYVLDACDGEERETIAAHIEACESCRALARHLQPVAAALLLASQEASAPDRLRSKILGLAASSFRQAVRSEPESGRAPAGPRWRRRIVAPARFRPRASVVAIAALAMGFVALAGWNVDLNARVRQLSQPPAQHRLIGTGPMVGTGGTATVLTLYGYTLVDLDGMPRPPQGKVYELWLIKADGQPQAARVFTPDRHGRAQIVLMGTLGGVRALAVTVEQGPDGVAAPTQHPHLSGPV